MAFEYIRLSKTEKIYSQKNSLLGQLALLNSLKHYHTYKEIRKEELMLKILLKKHLEEAKQSIELLNALLPKTQENLIFEKENPHRERKISLEQEIDSIKQRLKFLT